MKRLFIIGNGFDLAHRLPTKYLDYRSFLLKDSKNEYFCMRMENTYGLGVNADYWWRDFENSLGEGYIFEAEFDAMAKCAIDDMVTDDGEEMYDIEETLRYHFKPYYDFMNKLNETVLQWIESIDISEIEPIFKRITPQNSYYFTFNYTDVLEDVYNIPENKVCHIHGSKYEKSVIMGHGNLEVMKKYQKEIDEKEHRLDKNGAEISRGIYYFYTASFKNTKDIIENNQYVFDQYRGINEVHVFGHSLGEVDMPYFKEIKNRVLKTADWFFYIFCNINEFSDKKKELHKKIECLRINRKHIHVCQSSKF